MLGASFGPLVWCGALVCGSVSLRDIFSFSLFRLLAGWCPCYPKYCWCASTCAAGAGGGPAGRCLVWVAPFRGVGWCPGWVASCWFVGLRGGVPAEPMVVWLLPARSLVTSVSGVLGCMRGGSLAY